MKVLHIVGARPNLMKAAPVFNALKRRGFEQALVHTGQHYDAALSGLLFRQLELPEPDVNLGVGSASHAQQTAAVLSRLEPVVLERKPDWVMLYGDVNSTLAGALLASKLRIRVAHVEAGLRSFDREMPEELNRLVTDQLSDLLFTHSPEADDNLRREGIAPEKIRRVGNVMIDTLVRLLPKARRPELPGLAGPYILVTLHRPSNVDEPGKLARIVAALERLSRRAQVVFPVHPRTRARLNGEGAGRGSGLLFTEPLGYFEFLALQKDAAAVVTDSGGIQEETTYLGVPCLTVRENTERPVTITLGTNQLVGGDMGRLLAEAEKILDGKGKTGTVPPLWDGMAAERIADVLGRR